MAAIPPPNPRANDVAACQRKRRYSPWAAYRRIAELKATGVNVRAYECSHCTWLHLTKMGATK